MPLGSSSEAPVVRPGPSFARNPLSGKPFTRPGDEERGVGWGKYHELEQDLDINSYLPAS